MMLSQLASVNSLHIIDHQLNKLSMWVDPHRKKELTYPTNNYSVNLAEKMNEALKPVK